MDQRPKWFNNKISFFPGIDRADSSEEELDESTVEEEVEEEKGKQTWVIALKLHNKRILPP